MSFYVQNHMTSRQSWPVSGWLWAKY